MITPAAPRFALRMRDIVKAFGGVRALDGAGLDVRAGTIHGLVGQNGAGKSTLMKILAGIQRPDSGSIEASGRLVGPLTPPRAEKLGIHFIHQDRLLVPTFTPAEALFLRHEPTHGPWPLLDRRRAERQAAELLSWHFELRLPPGALVGELSAAEQQIIQILRALLQNPAVLVFDEPTAALGKGETDRLFTKIRQLREQGQTVIYISHYLSEIEALCDEVTVLRNGRNVGTVRPEVTPARTLVSMMVARDVDEMFPARNHRLGAVRLDVRGLAVRGTFSEVGFTVRAGEVVGLTGLLGSGAKEVVRCLFGLTRPSQGQVLLDGQVVRLPTPQTAARRGFALIPEDRRGHGVALGLTVRENLTLANLRRFQRLGFLRLGAERREVDGFIAQLAIRTPHRDALLRNLSGGNQQKVVLAKWLSRQARLYLLDEPTVGVDVGAKAEIYRLLIEVAQQGAAVLVLSTDLLELKGLCHRVLVMHRGRISREFRGENTNEDELLAAVTGAEPAVAALHP